MFPLKFAAKLDLGPHLTFDGDIVEHCALPEDPAAEALAHPGKLAWWSAAAAEARKQADDAALMLELVAARLDQELRGSGGAKRLTEPQLAHMIRKHQDYGTAREQLARLTAQATLAEGIRDAMRQRGEILVALLNSYKPGPVQASVHSNGRTPRCHGSQATS